MLLPDLIQKHSVKPEKRHDFHLPTYNLFFAVEVVPFPVEDMIDPSKVNEMQMAREKDWEAPTVL